MNNVTFKICDHSEMRQIVKDYLSSEPIKVVAGLNKKRSNATLFRVSWNTHHPDTDDEYTHLEVEAYLRDGWRLLDLESQETVLSAIGIEWEV
jgi:hypothetical protein